MKLSTLQATLGELGVRPSKGLGQNFLHDQNLAEWVVEQLALTADDHLVEIGPGLGALSEFAVPRCKSATLIEKDSRLAEFLRKRFASDTTAVIHEDALEFDPRTLFPRQPVKLLGNLPYYVTSPVLARFAAEPSPCDRIVLTIQREFAERLAAKPASKDYGALTLVIGRQWRVEYLRTIPGSVFLPAPKVESAVIALSPRELTPCDGELFNTLVKTGFSQRRKQLRKLLAPHVADWPALCEQLGITATTRAEELSLDRWIALTNTVRPVNVAEAQDVHGEMFDVVDADDRVLGCASRHTVHESRSLHRAVHIFVFNTRGELFLQRRSRWKDVHPRKWDSSAAGHVNSGGTYAETAPRELKEELGVEAPLDEIAAIPASRATGYEFVRLSRARHDGPFTFAPAEIECGSFFPLEVIDDWTAARPDDFASGFLECYRRARPLISPA